MSKIKILVLPSDKTGVGKFRSVDPHRYLNENHSDDFEVTIDYEPNMDDESYWKNYDIIHFHRVIGNDYRKTIELLGKFKSWGIKSIMDIDDYWSPGVEHPAHNLIKTHNIDKLIIENVKNSEYITTTTELFAKEINKFNKNVFVIPNAIDTDEPQFNVKTEKSEKLRFGWLGGSSHLHDIRLLDGATAKLSDLKNQFQFFICGFDTRGTVTEINPQTKETKKRPIKPEETVWFEYENIVTNKYNFLSEEHKEFLLKFERGDFSDKNAFYHRIWTEPVEKYASNYSKFDVSLAPLKDTLFNRLKSQLKVIEAGFYKKALIASDIGPYTLDLKHSLDKGEFTNGNALLVDKSRNKSDWAKYMKKLIQNPSFVEDLGERLYETVNGKYDLKSATKLRSEIYKSII
jgi:glycosyltransferase involved in cell wall biosynthesis